MSFIQSLFSLLYLYTNKLSESIVVDDIYVSLFIPLFVSINPLFINHVRIVQTLDRKKLSYYYFYIEDDGSILFLTSLSYDKNNTVLYIFEGIGYSEQDEHIIEWNNNVF